MERLEPILKQKFWILLGIGMVMTITGWWMATGSLAATIKTRTDVVKGAFGKIPSGEIPNNDWSSELAGRNTEQDRAINYTKSLLWERQRARMSWPDTVAEFAWQNGYRGEIPLAGRENYRTAYGYDVRRVWESVRPFKQLDGSGIVVFGPNERVLPQRTWGTLAPSSAEMWDAQEDLWLLESLLQSIVDVNGGPEASRGDASVHVIEKLELHGGLPPSQRKAAGAAPAGGSGGMSMPGGPGGAHGAGGSSSFGGSGGGEMGLGGGGRGAAIASADFDWREELGDDGSSNARGAGGPMGSSSGSSSMSGPAAAHGMGGAASGPGGAAAASTVRRYVEDDKALPYVSRGFYMTVIMDHRKIPSLVAELSASEKSAWPVEIVRVQMVRLHDDDVDSRGVPGSSGGYGPPGGGRPSFNLNSMNSGGSSSGFPSPAGFEGDASSAAFGDPSLSGPGTQNAAALSQVAAATAALEGALQDPFMARVAICGIITLYREVKPEPVAAPAAQPAPVTPAPTAAPATAESPASPDGNPPAASPDGSAPANPATPEAKPGEPGDAPASPPAATPEKATPEPTAPEAAPKAPPGGNG